MMAVERTQLLLVRHGKTAWNREGKLQGTIDIPLEEDSKEEIAKLAEILRGRNIRSIYTSPLKRAVETARIIQVEIRVDQLFADNNLRERNVGSFQGKSVSDLPAPYNKIGLDLFFAQAPIDDGEPIQEFNERTLATIKRIAQKHQGESVLVVTHGGNIRTILDSVNQSLITLPDVISNSTVFVLEVAEERIRLIGVI